MLVHALVTCGGHSRGSSWYVVSRFVTTCACALTNPTAEGKAESEGSVGKCHTVLHCVAVVCTLSHTSNDHLVTDRRSIVSTVGCGVPLPVARCPPLTFSLSPPLSVENSLNSCASMLAKSSHRRKGTLLWLEQQPWSHKLCPLTWCATCSVLYAAPGRPSGHGVTLRPGRVGRRG